VAVEVLDLMAEMMLLLVVQAVVVKVLHKIHQ
jgi:hypothetical protein